MQIARRAAVPSYSGRGSRSRAEDASTGCGARRSMRVRMRGRRIAFGRAIDRGCVRSAAAVCRRRGSTPGVFAGGCAASVSAVCRIGAAAGYRLRRRSYRRVAERAGAAAAIAQRVFNVDAQPSGSRDARRRALPPVLRVRCYDAVPGVGRARFGVPVSGAPGAACARRLPVALPVTRGALLSRAASSGRRCRRCSRCRCRLPFRPARSRSS